MKHIISIQGLKGSGKDTAAQYIRYFLDTPAWMHVYWIAKLVHFKTFFHRWKIVRYADSLKKMLAVMLNVDVERFEDRDFKENYYFDFNNYHLLNASDAPLNTITDKRFAQELDKGNLNVALEHCLSIRQILQFFGTEIMRKFFGNKLWIYTVLNLKDSHLIISDQRFRIENYMISTSGCKSLIIHIVRDGISVGFHASEKEIEDLYNNNKYDILLNNNGTLKDLFYSCRDIVYCHLY